MRRLRFPEVKEIVLFIGLLIYFGMSFLQFYILSYFLFPEGTLSR